MRGARVLLPIAAGGAAGGGGCTIVDGVEQKQPNYYDEVAAADAGACCAACGSDPKCVFWSFKASDVSKGIPCRRFDRVSTVNKSQSEFVSGSAPPPAAPTPPPPAGPALRLRVDGARLVDPSGAPIRLTGFNWQLNHLHDGDGVLMKQQLPAANLARIVGVIWDNSGSSSDCMTNTPPYWKESCFDELDHAVKQATDAKVWVILAARCAIAAGQNYQSDPQSDVFHNATLASMHQAMWKHVAAHYASWDYIAAYEVMAEPRDKDASAQAVRDFYAAACAAAQSADAATPCVVGSGPYYKLWTFTDDIIIADNPNVIYTFDYFVPEHWAFGEDDIPQYPGTYPCNVLYKGWTQQCCPKGATKDTEFNAERIADDFSTWAVTLRSKHNVPVLLNQWEVVHGVTQAQGRYQYISDVAKALQDYDIGWAWWVWAGGGDGWAHGSSGFIYRYSNGTIDFDELAFDAVRPYI